VKKESRPATVLFNTCINGHETTLEAHFIYDAMNRRVCRRCAREKTLPKSKKKGMFT
jgi:hypothetical protein